MTYSEHELEFTFAKNRLIFGKVKAYKNGTNFLGHPVLVIRNSDFISPLYVYSNIWAEYVGVVYCLTLRSFIVQTWFVYCCLLNYLYFKVS